MNTNTKQTPKTTKTAKATKIVVRITKVLTTDIEVEAADFPAAAKKAYALSKGNKVKWAEVYMTPGFVR